MLTVVIRARSTARRRFPRWTAARRRRIDELAAPNPHRDCDYEPHRDMRRGFLPQGLSNTSPQTGVVRRPVLYVGQVSDKPKRKRPLGKEGLTDGSQPRPARRPWPMLP